MTDVTPRLGFPLLASGQAQKEITHNEALTQADMLVQAVVQAVAPPAIPVAPQPGQCWIVGASPTGDWAGKAGQVAPSRKVGVGEGASGTGDLRSHG